MMKNKASVLILDDEIDIRDILRLTLEDAGFQCTTAGSVEEGLAALAQQEFDLAFSDIRMPGRPAGDLIEEIRRSNLQTQVIMITALNTAETAVEYLRMGAADYILKPFNISDVLLAADRAMEKKRLELANCEFQRYLEQMADDKAAETNRLFYSITQILIRLLELRAPLDIGHSVNVAEIARHIALELKMTKDGIRKVHLAALLHDVGMIPVEDLLIQKRGSLTESEYRQIQEHSALAENVLRPILDDGEVLKYIRHHHERYDGAGYPDGLKGNIIPLGARIIAVAEAFDAMSRSRPYRKAMSARLALAELERCTDTQFDPQVVAAFTRIYDQVSPSLQPLGEGAS
jgi:putative two-component system response regulator